MKNDLFSQFRIDIQHIERNIKQLELNIQESNTMKEQKQDKKSTQKDKFSKHFNFCLQINNRSV